MTRLSARGGVEFDCSGRFQRDRLDAVGGRGARGQEAVGYWKHSGGHFFLHGKELTDKQGEEHLDSPPLRRGKARYHTSLA